MIEIPEPSWAYQIGIPHPDGTLDTDLSHQETIHPPKSELHIFDALFIHMCGQWTYSR